MTNSTVDIIIPCFNTGRYLRQAIDSALAQTYPHINILVVDDGSTDDTREIVQSYESRVGYFYQENKGLPAARNTGISQTHGEFVCLLDADDVILPHMVEDQVGQFDQDDRVDITYGKTFDFCDDDIAHPVAEWRPHRDWEDYVQPFSVTCMVHLGSSLIRRSCFQRFGLFTQELAEQGCEDWAFWLSSAIQGAVFKHIPRVHGLYRQHAGSMSSSKFAVARRESELIKLAARMFDHCDVSEPRRLKVLSCGITSIAALWLPLGQRERFQELLDLSNNVLASSVRESQINDSFPYLPDTPSSVVHLALSKEFFDLGLPELAVFMFLKCDDMRNLRDDCDRHQQSALFERVLNSVDAMVSAKAIRRVDEPYETPSPSRVGEAKHDSPPREGKEFYLELERIVPHHASFHGYVKYQLGLLAENLGDLQKAERQFRDSVALNPNFRYARIALARALESQRNYPAAEKELISCLALYPGFATGILDHAKVLVRMGRYGRAASEFLKALWIDPVITCDYLFGWMKSLLRKGLGAIPLR